MSSQIDAVAHNLNSKKIIGHFMGKGSGSLSKIIHMHMGETCTGTSQVDLSPTKWTALHFTEDRLYHFHNRKKNAKGKETMPKTW